MKRENRIFLLILTVFLLTRFLGLGQVYHQDEAKWIVSATLGEFNPIHPPLTSFLLINVGNLIGYDWLRLVPIIFSVLVLILAGALARQEYGPRAAFWTAIILLVSTYNWLASVQIDIDGALLPFFVILLFWSYYQIDFRQFRQKKNYFWSGLLLVALAGGFLTKLSFVIAVAALATEACLRYRPPLKVLIKVLLGVVVGGGLVGLVGVRLVLGDQIVRLADIFNYIHRFDDFNLLNRNYSQLAFLTIKALILSSPLLLGGYVLGAIRRGMWQRYRLWWLFLIYNLLFYLVIFDFTHGGTVERYLMFLILPGAIIGGAAIAELFRFSSLPRLFWRTATLIAVFLLAGWAWLVSMPVRVLPLQPKAAYWAQLRQLDFQFLIPITGGSGPIGFYISALFITLMFGLVTLALVIVAAVKREHWRQVALVFVIVGGIFYNLVLDFELITGQQYGSVSRVAKRALSAVVNDPAIPGVITYYDTGRYELRLAGKYRNRFYTNPPGAPIGGEFSAHAGYFLVVDFPEINKRSLYWKYLASCQVKHRWQDRLVKAFVFDCARGDRSIFK